MVSKKSDPSWDEFTKGFNKTLKSIKKRRLGFLIFFIILLPSVFAGGWLFSRINRQGMDLYDPPFDDINYLNIIDIMKDNDNLNEGLFENVKITSGTTRSIHLDGFFEHHDYLINFTIQWNTDICDIKYTETFQSHTPLVEIDYGNYHSYLFQGSKYDDYTVNTFQFTIQGLASDGYFDIYYEIFENPFQNITSIENAFNLDYLLQDEGFELWNLGNSPREDGYDDGYFDLYQTATPLDQYYLNLYFRFSTNETKYMDIANRGTWRDGYISVFDMDMNQVQNTDYIDAGEYLILIACGCTQYITSGWTQYSYPTRIEFMVRNP